MKNLTLLDWEEKYSVGFKLIDEQHKRLFALYNKIVIFKKQENQTSSQESQEVLGQIIKELSDYVHVHFLTEEEILKVYGYSEFDAHKKIHDQFSNSVSEISNDFANGQLILIDTFVRKIHNWLVHHVLVEDRKYINFIK